MDAQWHTPVYGGHDNIRGNDLDAQQKILADAPVILLASAMHASALIMIPIIFLVQGEAWNPKTLLAILATIVVLLFINQFTDILSILLSDAQYENVVSDWQSMNDDGTNILRVIVYSVPTILSIVGLRIIREQNDPVVNLSTNLAIISTALYAVSMSTSGIFLGRLPIYCSLYGTCILLPWEIENLFTPKSGRIIAIAAVLMFLMFYTYQLRVGWGVT